MRQIWHRPRSVAPPPPLWQSAGRGVIVLLAWVAVAGCSSASADAGTGCAHPCTQNSECPRIVCSCTADGGGSVNFDGFCSDRCCGGCPPGCH